MKLYVSFHTLRYSYASYSLGDGVDLRQIQAALVQNLLKTTEIYTCLAVDIPNADHKTAWWQTGKPDRHQ